MGNNGTLIKSVTITFPSSFASPPSVYASVKNESTIQDQFCTNITNVTSTGFTIIVLRIDITSVDTNTPGWGQNLLVDWVATN
jgi:hypothetical protein